MGRCGLTNREEGRDVEPITMMRGGRKGGDYHFLFGHKQTRRARQQVVMLGSTVSHQANLPPPIDCSEQDSRSLRGLLVREQPGVILLTSSGTVLHLHLEPHGIGDPLATVVLPLP